MKETIRGWFDHLQKESNLHNIRITREAASADTAIALIFRAMFKAVIER